MTSNGVLCFLLLALGAGCGQLPRAQEAPLEVRSEEPGALEPDAGAEAPTWPPGTSATAPGESVLALDAALDHPVRGRLESYDKWTFVEVCVREIVAATPERPAQVRYTMRLCTEDGRTEAVAMRRSRKADSKILFTDSLYETTPGGTSHLFFACPYGTGWEIDATAERVEGDRVRLVLSGVWLCCTK